MISFDIQISASVDTQPSKSIDMMPIASTDTLRVSDQTETVNSKFGGRTRKRKNKKKKNVDGDFLSLVPLPNVNREVLSIECIVEEFDNLLPRSECYVIQN